MPRALLVACCTIVCSTSLAVPPAAAGDPPSYRRPVTAAVSEPFVAPATPYGPGHRGLTYATEAGTVVRAAADGTVTFAGSVAGSLHVTILHADGVRTTYSFLREVTVVAGQRVRQGAPVGETAGALHFGARRGDAYFDPASLFEPGVPQVRLVPFDEPPGTGAAGERSAVAQLIGGLGALVADSADAAGVVAGWLRDGEGQLLRTAGHYARRFTFPLAAVDASFTLVRAWQRAQEAANRPCSGGAERPAPPAQRRVAVLVAGLGSDSGPSTIDQLHTDALGYAAPDVLRFSYAGGRVPDGRDGLVGIPAAAYDSADTQRDLREAGRRLADLLEAVAREASGAPIDLYAHSQGGVVARLALVELERRHGVDWLDRLGLVATLGSPHGGADLATGIHALSSTVAGAAALDVYSAATDQALDHDGTSTAQLAETSELVQELQAHPVPAGLRALSIAARGDLIVPVPRTEAPGMVEVVVPLMGPTAHSDLPGSPEVTRELGLALAGRPPSCQSLADALVDQGVGEAISLVEDLAGSLGLLGGAAVDVRTG